MQSEASEYSIYRRAVSQLMRGEEQLPSLPAITLEIRRALADVDTSLSKLVGLIGRDPALSALLMKHASSALYRHSLAPKTLREVIILLGMGEVDRITMVHSIKSLFTLQTPGHKRLFVEAWERLTIKASTCAILARVLGHVTAEHALLASLLSEVGSLVVLSAFKSESVTPSSQLYEKLCNEYGKSLGIIVLKKWSVDEHYIDIVREAGNWQSSPGRSLQLLDMVNLALYHTIREYTPAAELPPLRKLAAYQKLLPPQDFITDNDKLGLVVSRRDDILSLAQAMR